MATAKQLLKEKQQEEMVRRLSAPQHMVQNQFTQHQRIEGYYQDRDVKDFYGCDRLLKLDTMYGTIQLGYDPKRGQSFLFANIKTSIYDTAASGHQRALWESQMMKTQKSGNQNLAYSSRRRENSAALLYKMENRPWSEESAAPYLNRINLETLGKTMPFLSRTQEAREREQGRRQKKQLEQGVRESLAEGNREKTAELRQEENRLLHRQDALGSLLYRKQAASRNFFRRVNMAFDLQKQKMFDYYRRERQQRRVVAENATLPKDEDAEDKKR